MTLERKEPTEPLILTIERTEEAAAEGETRFSLVFEKSPDPVLLLDKDVFIDCNEAALVCLGYSRKHDIIGMHPWDLSPARQPDGRLSLHKGQEIIEAVLSKGTYRFEWLQSASDGEQLLMDVFITLVPLQGKQILYTVWRDITARKRAEDALRISELRLSEAMDLARVAHWELDPERERFFLNDRFYALYGTTAQREGGYVMAMEDYVHRFVHPEDVELFDREFVKSEPDKNHEFFKEFEFRILRRDLEIRYMATRIRTSRDVAGLRERYFGTNQDITEYKRTEKTLKESEELYRTAIEHCNDGVAIVRKNKHIFVNQRFLAMFGYDDPKEILGTHLYVTVHPDHHRMVMDINRANKSEENLPLRYEFKGIRKDGATIYIDVSSTRIVYQGEPSTLAYLRDITERVKSEEMLRQSQKMEAIGTLSAGIAHDFNNVLTAILGFAELSYEAASSGSKVKKYLSHVVSAAHRGKDLVTQILTFSRRNREEFQPTLLAPVVKNSIRMLRASLPKTIDIQEEITDKSLMVLADPTQIQQILMNLGTNAAHAMWETGGLMMIQVSHLTVTYGSVLPELPPGSYARLSITDTGTGVEKDIMERIFDPFFTTKKRGEGTGLGLWVVHSIVKNHKGTITMKSTPGQGSTFDVFLPLTDEPREQVDKQSLSGLKGHGRILIVDDETEIGQLEKIMVEKLGYQATAVTDSLEAIKMFMKNPTAYDLVLTNQAMPGMTGISLARELISIRGDIPVALVTGYRDTVDTVAAREAGIKLILPKPIARADLGTAIKQMLRRGR